MTAHEGKQGEAAAQEQAAAATAQKTLELPEGALVYEAPEFFPESCPTWLRTLVEDVWSFTLIHYNIWAVPVLVLFYFMYQVRGASHSMLSPMRSRPCLSLSLVMQWGYGLVVVALVALYLPSFLDGSHKTGTGRAWEGFRRSRIWNVSANFLG